MTDEIERLHRELERVTKYQQQLQTTFWETTMQPLAERLDDLREALQTAVTDAGRLSLVYKEGDLIIDPLTGCIFRVEEITVHTEKAFQSLYRQYHLRRLTNSGSVGQRWRYREEADDESIKGYSPLPEDHPLRARYERRECKRRLSGD